MSGGGRRVAARKAPRQRRGPDRSVLTAVALVLLAALAVVLPRVAGLGEDADVASGGVGTEGALVDRTQLACPATSLPDLSDEGVRTRTVAGLVADDPDGGELGDGGRAGIAPVGEQPEPLDLGRGRVTPLPRTDEEQVVDADGELAAGLFAFRTDESGSARAVGTCAEPRNAWWFTGLGADLDHSSQVVMANVDPGPAVVDVRVLGPEGEVDTIGTRGITIAPGETVELSLADVAPQTRELVVQVQASRGRVAVAAADRFAAGAAAPVGFAWVGDAAGPSRTVRLAGIPAAAPAKTLVVGNPSESEALVEVEVAGRAGSFVPSGLEEVSVAPGTVETLDLADALPPREAVTVRVRAQVPVTASLRTSSRTDVTYADVAQPLTGPAVAPVPAPSGAVVHLTAGPGAARARVEGFRADGRSTGADEVELDPTATGTWRPGGGSAYVVVTPLAGRVHGAAVYGGTGLASLPLRPVPVRIQVPAVAPGP